MGTRSAAQSDVSEAITLLLAAARFEVAGAPAALRRMLPLVFSREQSACPTRNALRSAPGEFCGRALVTALHAVLCRRFATNPTKCSMVSHNEPASLQGVWRGEQAHSKYCTASECGAWQLQLLSWP